MTQVGLLRHNSRHFLEPLGEQLPAVLEWGQAELRDGERGRERERGQEEKSSQTEKGDRGVEEGEDGRKAERKKEREEFF